MAKTEQQISRDELVKHMIALKPEASAHKSLRGPDLAKAWNDLFPDFQVEYRGDGMYSWECVAEYLKKQITSGDEFVIGHDELVQRIADAHGDLEGKELVEIWNDMFPATPVKYLGDSIYAWEKKKKPIPKCPNCNGEVELSGEGDNVNCHCCGYSGPPGFHQPGSVPGCIACASSGRQVAARYLVSEIGSKVWDGACLECAVILNRRETQTHTHTIRVHPLAAEWATLDDLEKFRDAV